jgi:uncharacterized protein YcfL
MRKILILGISLFMLASCSNNKKPGEIKKLENEVKTIEKSVKKLKTEAPPATKIFNVKSGYVKYKSQVAGMDMIREWWFDNYGALQYEENYMIMMDQKTGGAAVVRDGYRYNWNFNAKEGTKNSFSSAGYTDYDNVSKEDIERYKMKKLGYENIAGKKCMKVSIEKPVEATTWTWEGVPMKTLTKFGGKDVIMEAVEMKDGGIPSSKFDLPKDITFKEM